MLAPFLQKIGIAAGFLDDQGEGALGVTDLLPLGGLGQGCAGAMSVRRSIETNSNRRSA